jgi:hypothetical protein
MPGASLQGEAPLFFWADVILPGCCDGYKKEELATRGEFLKKL